MYHKNGPAKMTSAIQMGETFKKTRNRVSVKGREREKLVERFQNETLSGHDRPIWKLEYVRQNEFSSKCRYSILWRAHLARLNSALSVSFGTDAWL